MKRQWRMAGAVIVTLLLLAISAHAEAQRDESEDKTLSPYFFVKSDDPETDQLPLKSTSVEVNISGVIADVVVTQMYKNEGKKPLEAIYVFPASTKAAVYGMRMTIGDRTITATVREREKARREYEDAKRAGKSVSLLEQQRPNVFQMKVANIMPSDVIEVELKYTELLAPEDGIYQFVYPTVVGPRYVEEEADNGNLQDEWTKSSYLHQGKSPTYTYDMAVNLTTGLPIQKIKCPTHQVDINYENLALATVKTNPSEKYGGNRDFILKYQLSGRRIETGLLLFEGEKEKFFLLMLQPPERRLQVEVPPREYIFIMDVSGSMRGYPIDISRRLLKDAVGNLRPIDRFNILLFASSSALLSKESLPATEENIRNAVNMIDGQVGSGGTELLAALNRALSIPKTKGNSRTIVIATDGYVRVEKEVFDLIRRSLGNANIFAFGIGTSVNRHIIEGIARVGMGEPFIITNPGEAPKKAKKFRQLIQTPALTDIKIEFDQLETYDVEPKSIPDVMSDRPVIVFGKWRGRPQGRICIQGNTGDRHFKQTINVSDAMPLGTNAALRYLWARYRITLLSDLNRLNPQDERVREVTSLGLSYNLLTAHTSFIAVDSKIRLSDGKAVTIKQPLPLPRGVSDLALGNVRCAKNAGLGPVGHANMAFLIRRMGDTNVAYEYDDSIVRSKHGEGTKQSSVYSRKTSIRLKRIEVSQGLVRYSVEDVIISHMHSIRKCLKDTLGLKGSKGEFTLRLSVGRDGGVTQIKKDWSAVISQSEADYSDFERCIMQKLQALQFVVQDGVQNPEVTITFVLA